MAARQASEEFAVRAFWYAWLRSILDHLSLTDLSVGSFSAEAQQKAVREFSDGDRHHIETTSARVRRAYAENAIRARDQFKDQAALVQHQAGLKRRHLPVRDFVRNAADVLAGAQTVLGDEPAGGQPAAAAAALLRRRHLRRGLPDHARRRGHLDPAGQAARGRRGRQAAPAHRVLRLRQHRGRLRPARAGRTRASDGGHRGIRVDPGCARLGAALPPAAVALPKPRRTADRLLQRAHLRPDA